MKKLLSVCLLLLFATTFYGCSTSSSTIVSNIGDGKVDEVEAASINLAVGIYLSANPKIIKPTYDISTILLEIIDGNVVTSVSVLDTYLNAEVSKLNFDNATLQSFKDLVVLVKARIAQDLKAIDISENDKVIVVRDVIRIVQQAAYTRL